MPPPFVAFSLNPIFKGLPTLYLNSEVNLFEVWLQNPEDNEVDFSITIGLHKLRTLSCKNSEGVE